MLRLPALVVDKMQGWAGSKRRSCTVRLEQENGCGGLSGGGDSLLLKGATAGKLGGGFGSVAPRREAGVQPMTKGGDIESASRPSCGFWRIEDQQLDIQPCVESFVVYII
jgi:hypothetical protein